VTSDFDQRYEKAKVGGSQTLTGLCVRVLNREQEMGQDPDCQISQRATGICGNPIVVARPRARGLVFETRHRDGR